MQKQTQNHAYSSTWCETVKNPMHTAAKGSKRCKNNRKTHGYSTTWCETNKKPTPYSSNKRTSIVRNLDPGFLSCFLNVSSVFLCFSSCVGPWVLPRRLRKSPKSGKRFAHICVYIYTHIYIYVYLTKIQKNKGCLFVLFCFPSAKYKNHGPLGIAQKT